MTGDPERMLQIGIPATMLSWQEKAENCCFRKEWWQRGGWPETGSVGMFSVTSDRKLHQTGLNKLTPWKKSVNLLDWDPVGFSGTSSGLVLRISQLSLQLSTQACSPPSWRDSHWCLLASIQCPQQLHQKGAHPFSQGFQ